ncbi:MAG: ABC transporter permease [Prolixibacteraceae bacterium]|nr:ABC transporter permease [Prolixibacteraceae bacterium]
MIIKEFFRKLYRKPLNPLINIVGLSLSLATVIFLVAYSYSELTVDSFHKDGENIFLLTQSVEGAGMVDILPYVLKEELTGIPGIVSSIRIREQSKTTYQVGTNTPIIANRHFVDDTFFDFFSYKAVYGDLKTALKKPMSLVLSSDEALKLFGDKNPVGETVKMDDEHLLTVTAVIEKPKQKSSFYFKSIIPLESFYALYPEEKLEKTKWGSSYYQILIETQPENSISTIEKAVAALHPVNLNNTEIVKCIPLAKVYSNYIAPGSKTNIIVLLSVAFLVLLIATINYLTLSFTQFTNKLNQTALKSIIGANRWYLLKYYLFESFVIYLLSLAVAYILLILFTNPIKQYTNIDINSDIFYSPIIILSVVSICLVLSVISIIIPAIKLNLTSLLDNIKNNKSKQLSSSQGLLLVVQFAASIALIAFTFLINNQIRFGTSQVSFPKNQIVTIKLNPDLKKEIAVLKNELRQVVNIDEFALSNYDEMTAVTDLNFFNITVDGQKHKVFCNNIDADVEFLNIMNLKCVKGKLFKSDVGSDKGAIVVNEEFIRYNNLTDPIGVKIFGHEIIGVVEDFHFQDVNKPISPLLIWNQKNDINAYIKTNSSDFNSLQKVYDQTKRICTNLSPGFPVEIDFFDNTVRKMYSKEIQFRNTFSLFSMIAIFICCIGILALSIYTSQMRIKEIGIRKVNGAKISEVMTMLNKDFVRWVLIAFVIATPAAWFAMHQWLQSFAYQTSLSWWIFALAGLLALGIALLTVSFQSWKAATKNPVESLRYE